MQLNTAIQHGNKLTAFRMDDRFRGSFKPIQCALPWELGTFVAVMFSFGTCCWQEMEAIEQQIACDRGMHIGEEGEHEDLGIVEDMAAIAKAGQSFGGY